MFLDIRGKMISNMSERKASSSSPNNNTLKLAMWLYVSWHGPPRLHSYRTLLLIYSWCRNRLTAKLKIRPDSLLVATIYVGKKSFKKGEHSGTPGTPRWAHPTDASQDPVLASLLRYEGEVFMLQQRGVSGIHHPKAQQLVIGVRIHKHFIAANAVGLSASRFVSCGFTSLSFAKSENVTLLQTLFCEVIRSVCVCVCVCYKGERGQATQSHNFVAFLAFDSFLLLQYTPHWRPALLGSKK